MWCADAEGNAVRDGERLHLPQREIEMQISRRQIDRAQDKEGQGTGAKGNAGRLEAPESSVGRRKENEAVAAQAYYGKRCPLSTQSGRTASYVVNC